MGKLHDCAAVGRGAWLEEEGVNELVWVLLSLTESDGWMDGREGGKEKQRRKGDILPWSTGLGTSVGAAVMIAGEGVIFVELRLCGGAWSGE